MALIECPTRKDLPAYHYTISLDGVTYTLTFKWNSRMNDGQGKWTISIGDIQGNDLLSDIPLVANWPLIDRFRVVGQPPGSLLAFDTSLQNSDPGRFDLGDRVRIFYNELVSS